eukprot:symbB.v1.2.017155.t1/scaffold1331.1/size125086/9
MGNQQVKCPNCDGKGHLGLASHGIAGAVVGGLLLGPFGLLLGSAAGLKAAQCERCDGTGMVIDGQASQSEPSYQTPSGWHRRQGKTMTMYHGTSQSNARSIVANGFRPSTGGMLGAGVYVTADPEKAKRYGNTLITVEVKTGKTKKITSQSDPMRTTWNSHGYNSAWVPANCGMVTSGLTETCVFNPNRLRVRHVA